MDEAAFEAALDRDRLGRRDEFASFALRTGLDQRAAARVLKDEFVAEDFGDLALHGDRAPIAHRSDGGRRERKNDRRAIEFRDRHQAGAQGEGDDGNGGDRSADGSSAARRAIGANLGVRVRRQVQTY